MKKIIYFLIFIISLPVLISVLSLILQFLVGLLGINTDFLASIIVISLILCVIWGLTRMRKDYKQISNNQKSNYWTIATNIFLVLFTFWMGIFVQDLIATKNSKINDKLLKIQYVDNILPDLKYIWEDEAFSNCKELLSMGVSCQYKINSYKDSITVHPEYSDSLQRKILEIKKDSTSYMQMYKSYLVNHKKEIIEFGYRSDSIMSKYRYYVTDAELADSIRSNSLALRLALYAAEITLDSTLLNKDMIIGRNDTITKFDKIEHYYAHQLSSPSHQLSAGMQHDLDKGAKLSTIYYGISSSDSLTIFNEIVKGCINNTMLMNEIMLGEDLKENGIQDIIYKSFLDKVLSNPISTFIITLLFAILACALFSQVLSPSTGTNREDAIKALDNKILKYEQQLQSYLRTNNSSEHKILAQDLEITDLKHKNELLHAQLTERTSIIESELSILSSIIKQNNHSILKEPITNTNNEQETNI